MKRDSEVGVRVEVLGLMNELEWLFMDAMVGLVCWVFWYRVLKV